MTFDVGISYIQVQSKPAYRVNTRFLFELSTLSDDDGDNKAVIDAEKFAQTTFQDALYLKIWRGLEFLLF